MDIFHHIADLLARGESLALATIVSRSGSAPRAVGSRMAVGQGGVTKGTIGGGILEARVKGLAQEVCGHGLTVLQEYTLTAQDAGGMGLICGGTVRILVQFLDASQPGLLELYQAIAASLKAGKRARLITALPARLEVQEPAAQCLINDQGAMVGDLDHQAGQILAARTEAGRPELCSHQGKTFLVETLCPGGTVYIFGAGHVSQQLAPLAALVGFRTVVLDDRQEFANRERFPGAAQVIVLNSFQQALEGLEITGDSYLVLVTRGHAHDLTLLRQALRTQAGYIGMIGSRRKRDAIYAALEQEGFSPEGFDRVFSPIGLEIEAETPAEIAVSIVAELILVRAGKGR